MKQLFFYLVILSVFSISCKKVKEPVALFELSEVRLMASPFYQAQKTDLKYILQLDADRLLAPYQKEAGMVPIRNNYSNWENTGLDGHIGGHYLSALSMMFASTGDSLILNRINYFVSKLKECQEAAGNGYLAGIPDGRQMWDEIAKGKIEVGTFSLNNKWVPLYNIHKIFAGLRDAYIFANSQDALNILISLSDWFLMITANLSDEQLQLMLISEHGGMNEVFVDVAKLTGDKKYLEFARRFSDYSVLNPLLSENINLVGMHANTQIPKVIGYKRYADVAKDISWNNAAKYFWNEVVKKMTVSIGGNSVREHFHSPDDFSPMIESEEGPETCNTYNMLKLTKLLYLSEHDPKYLEYYEKALYNHILSSQHPEVGGFVYFTPMRPQHYRVYSQVNTSFWCCVGSGLENHSKYSEIIYAHQGEDIMVNLFIPSELNWKECGVVLEQETSFPENNTITLKVKECKKSFNLLVRSPLWLKDKMPLVKVNNAVVNFDVVNGYIHLKDKVTKDDEVSVTFSMTTRIEYLPDGSNYASIAYGPIVLAAKTDTIGLDGLFADDSRMGHIAKGELRPLETAPYILSEEGDFTDKISPIKDKPLHFNIQIEGKKEMELMPFYEVHDSRYMIYFPVYSATELQEKIEVLKKKEQISLELERTTIDKVAPGEQQPEADHFFKGEKTNSGVNKEYFWRDASGWFSYILNDKNNDAKVLRVTYFSGDAGRQFRIIMNDQLLAKVELNPSDNEFYNIDYPLEKIKDKLTTGKIELRFVAEEGSIAGGIYGIRLMR